LSPAARPQAYKGALAAVETMRDGDFVGVFMTDLSLVTIQTYTSDRARIEKALHDVATRASSAFDRTATRDDLKDRDARGNLLPGDADPSVPWVASAESVGRPVDGRDSIDRLIGAVTSRTQVGWDTMARAQQGHATTNGLIALTSGLGVLPGRKSLVLFAEGLSIPDSVLPHFRNVVAVANLANVSVYTVDSAGLRVHSSQSATGREILGMGLAGIELSADGSNLSSLAMLERNEDALRKDPHASLSWLANQTGGFLIDNTNNLAAGFRRIDADRRFHYLLTYTPANTVFDGKWRAITVRVPGKRVTIRARSGYLAVPNAGGMPFLAYEAPALAALEAQPTPGGLPLRARALVFPAPGEARIAVLAATDGGAIRFERDAIRNRYRADFTILARIKDRAGNVVKKASEPYRLDGPLEDLDQVRAGEVLFFRQPDLNPGDYTLEVAVHDTLAARSGVHRSAFTVPDASERWQVSSLVLVRRAEKVAEAERQPGNPLYAGDVLLYPNVGEPYRKDRDGAMTLFCVFTGPRGAAPGVKLEVVRDGQLVAELPLSLSPADQTGRIEHIARFPLAPLDPGHYALRLHVQDGVQHTIRDAAFDLLPR
jgi:VWFA-related protein